MTTGFRPLKTSIVVALICLAGAYSSRAAVQSAGPTDAAFGISLYKAIASKSAGKNIVISPSSGFMVLALVAQGAGGNTAKQILQTLGVKGTEADLLKRIKEWQGQEKAKGVMLESANAIFVDEKAPVADGFISNTKKTFDAEIRPENFANQSIVDKINAWCAAHTHQKITSIVEHLDPESVMVLVNALYFKGKWLEPFNPADTSPGQFTVSSGKQESVKMMSRQANLPYLSGEGFKSIWMPYVGDDIQMLIFLPDKDSSLKAFQEKLTEKNWQTWLTSYQNCPVKIKMPKFKIAYQRKLNADLQQLKMTDAFSPDLANFSRMFKTNTLHPHIGFVIQKTYIDVNEEGTEAAAVTATGMSKGLEAPLPPQTFTVDRPFMFALINRKSNQLLFLGSIVNPLAK